MKSIPLPILHGDASPEPDVPRLDLYLLPPREAPRGAVLIAPGGGYALRAPHEGLHIAAALNAFGLHAFVLQYRVKPCLHPAPLADAVQAMRLIRQNATEWGVSSQHIAVCGFSAGGHLAGSLGVLHHLIPAPDNIPAAAANARPDAMILGYPVLSARAKHLGSFQNLLGMDAPESRHDEVSIETHVTPQTPPTFLWHTVDDTVVPVENTLLMAAALQANRVPFELHAYSSGKHGLGLANLPSNQCSPRVATWITHACGWLDELGWPR